VPLEKYFPEYTGGPDINKAAKYILWRFTQTNHWVNGSPGKTLTSPLFPWISRSKWIISETCRFCIRFLTPGLWPRSTATELPRFFFWFACHVEVPLAFPKVRTGHFLTRHDIRLDSPTWTQHFSRLLSAPQCPSFTLLIYLCSKRCLALAKLPILVTMSQKHY